MRCPVSLRQSIPLKIAFTIFSHGRVLPSLKKKNPSHFPHRRHFSHGCACCGSSSVCVVFSRTRVKRCCAPQAKFPFKWYVLFTWPYHEVAEHSWNTSFTPEIISWVCHSREPQFLHSASHLKASRFHTWGVSFCGAVLPTSPSAVLMVIILPDVSLLSRTPLAGHFQVETDHPVLNKQQRSRVTTFLP